MDLRARAQIRALCKQDQVLQLKHTLHDLICIPLDLNSTLVVRHDNRLTIYEISHTPEDQVRTRTGYFQLLR